MIVRHQIPVPGFFNDLKKEFLPHDFPIFHLAQTNLFQIHAAPPLLRHIHLSPNGKMIALTKFLVQKNRVVHIQDQAVWIFDMAVIIFESSMNMKIGKRRKKKEKSAKSL